MLNNSFSKEEGVIRIVPRYTEERIVNGIYEYPVYRVSDTVDINFNKFFGLFAKLTDRQMTNVDHVREEFYKFVSDELSSLGVKC
jgi:hypothetical protein